eukprot:310305-Hanusia_phi.AAC.2
MNQTDGHDAQGMSDKRNHNERSGTMNVNKLGQAKGQHWSQRSVPDVILGSDEFELFWSWWIRRERGGEAVNHIRESDLAIFKRVDA